MSTESQLEIKSADGGVFQSYVMKPELPHRLPAIVLIQEIFGINENIRWTARRYADAGFLVCAPDLFWRAEPGIELDPTEPQQRDRAMELSNQFDGAKGLSDCQLAIKAIRAHVACNGRVGAVGYCLGGRLAFMLASQNAVDAAVCFYPVAIQPALKTMHLSKVPLLVHLGAEDVLCTPEAQLEIKSFVEAEKSNRVVTYSAVGHGFARLGRKDLAATAAESAESTSISFLGQHLR